MFLLVNPLLIEDASLTSLQTEAFCPQNRYKTSSGRERVSATHTALSDQQDHPKRERSIGSALGLLTDSSSLETNQCPLPEQVPGGLESELLSLA